MGYDKVKYRQKRDMNAFHGTMSKGHPHSVKHKDIKKSRKSTKIKLKKGELKDADY